jgi:glycerate kinase
VLALCGSLAASAVTLDALGINAALPIADGPLSLEDSMSRAGELIERASERAGRLLTVGKSLTSR